MRKIDKIGIIGGKGSMGRWFESFFISLGYEVAVSDRHTALDNADIAGECPAVIISTPIAEAVKIAGDIGPLLTADQLLMDVCSQKEDIVNAMVAFSQSEVVGTHPMFGPFVDSIQGHNMVLTPGRGAAGLAWAKEIFTAAGACVTQVDAVEHDRHMAVVQGLTHFVSVCFARTLQKLDLHPANVFDISTPIFRINSDIIGRLFAQDPDLYATLVGENRYVKEVLELFVASLVEGREKLIDSDHQTGKAFINEVGGFIGNYTQEAMVRSNRFLNILLDR